MKGVLAINRPEFLRFGRFAAVLPYAWLLLFVLLPLFVLAKLSLSHLESGFPPYAPIFGLNQGLDGLLAALSELSIENYLLIFAGSGLIAVFLFSLFTAILATAIALLAGYPIAYGIAMAPSGIRTLLLMLITLPLVVSTLIRAYVWIGILEPAGPINQALLAIGLIASPLEMLDTGYAVLAGMIYSYLPIMIVTLYLAIRKMDLSLLEAAQDLGCKPQAAFWKVTFPLSLPGVAVGCLLVFIPSFGDIIVPDLLGGARTPLPGNTIWHSYFLAGNWPLGAAMATILLLILILPMAFLCLAANRMDSGVRGK